MMFYELKAAQGGTLDADLLAQTQFYGTNYTKPLLFIADGGYYANLATTLHLTGGQWGVMNETGSYPGQPWLWLYQLWYHVAPFSNSASVDIWAVYLTGIATILLLLIPFIPGLRDIPRLIPVHRLIWRGDYDQPAAPPASPARSTGSAEPGGAGDVLRQARRQAPSRIARAATSGPDDLVALLCPAAPASSGPEAVSSLPVQDEQELCRAVIGERAEEAESGRSLDAPVGELHRDRSCCLQEWSVPAVGECDLDQVRGAVHREFAHGRRGDSRAGGERGA